MIVHDHALPAGYTGKTVTIAIRIEGGYPPGKLDMAYFLPPLARADGVAIGKTETHNIEGGAYQRWSRHYPWREGIDSLATHDLHIKDWLESEPKR